MWQDIDRTIKFRYNKEQHSRSSLYGLWDENSWHWFVIQATILQDDTRNENQDEFDRLKYII